MSEHAPRASARQRTQKALQYRPNALNFEENALRVSLDELFNLDPRYGKGFCRHTLVVQF
jgi:hypothetical protein